MARLNRIKDPDVIKDKKPKINLIVYINLGITLLLCIVKLMEYVK